MAVNPLKLLPLEKQLAIYRKDPDSLPVRLRAKLRNITAQRKKESEQKAKARRAAHRARRPQTVFIQLSRTGKELSRTLVYAVEETRQTQPKYALPALTFIAGQEFHTEWWLDPYNMAPIQITRRPV